jgi:chloride channel protein, CIC family
MPRQLFLRLLRARLWLSERLRPSEGQIMLVWAGVVGLIGGLTGTVFRKAVDLVQWIATGHDENLVETAAALNPWLRVAVPALGGLGAGLILYLGSQFVRGRKPADYMEAIVLGDGVIRSRPVLVRIASSVVSIGTGSSIGREGPMVLLSSMCASLVGRWARFPRPSQRLLVACGAAASISAAYKAPIGGALFVSEIVLGSIAMETFGPLCFASVLATVVSRTWFGEEPLFEVPAFHLQSHWELFPYLVLGLVCGVLAPSFLKLLRASTQAFERIGGPIWVRTGLGGLLVGLLSLGVPDVWGNGYDAVSSILRTDVLWTSLVVLLVFKLVATAASVGSGAVGGVFTPTLLVGAVLGGLFGTPLHAWLPEHTASANAYAVAGMGAFLAATMHAPLMAIVCLFEMTLDYDVVLPLMICCVSAYYAARTVSDDSLYARIVRSRVETPVAALDRLRVRDLMRPDPISVTETTPFSDIVQTFVTHRHHNLYVVGAERQFRGVIPLHEIKPYLNSPELGRLVITTDLLREEFPEVAPESTLREALEKLTQHGWERLPVVDPSQGRRLVGSIHKTDLLLSLASTPKAVA